MDGEYVSIRYYLIKMLLTPIDEGCEDRLNTLL